WPRQWLQRHESSAIADWLVGQRRHLEQGRTWLRWLAAGLLLGASLWGAYELREVVNSRTALLTPADLEALAWIEDNVEPDALFLIQSSEWMAHVYAGSDGGYWITPLTGRRTWPPPALYGLGSADYIERVNQVASDAGKIADGATLYALLREHGFTHVYLGRYGGTLKPESFADRTLFRPLYQQNAIAIFALENHRVGWSEQKKMWAQ
ncbi:MAG: hypothetical protein JXA37_02650, partial [Chloroflexia bacterium]|nr:hypothetical protein [Chloroflexia bacterium]